MKPCPFCGSLLTPQKAKADFDRAFADWEGEIEYNRYKEQCRKYMVMSPLKFGQWLLTNYAMSRV